jgi:hypothetical protein
MCEANRALSCLADYAARSTHSFLAYLRISADACLASTEVPACVHMFEVAHDQRPLTSNSGLELLNM